MTEQSFCSILLPKNLPEIHETKTKATVPRYDTKEHDTMIAITTEEFKEGIDNNSFDLILDVRRQDEWDTGRIPGAVHLPVETLSEDGLFRELAKSNAGYSSCDKARARIVVYCRSGNRATKAIKQLEEMGLEGTLYNGGGTFQWVEAGYELTKESSPEPPPADERAVAPEVEEGAGPDGAS